MPNGTSIGSVVFVCVPNAMLYNALSMGKKTPSQWWAAIAAYHQHAGERLTHVHRQHAQKIWQRSRARMVPEISSRTDRHTDILITILHSCTRKWGNKNNTSKWKLQIYYASLAWRCDNDNLVTGGVWASTSATPYTLHRHTPLVTASTQHSSTSATTRHDTAYHAGHHCGLAMLQSFPELHFDAFTSSQFSSVNIIQQYHDITFHLTGQCGPDSRRLIPREHSHVLPTMASYTVHLVGVCYWVTVWGGCNACRSKPTQTKLLELLHIHATQLW